MRVKDRVAVGWIDPGTVDSEFAKSMIVLYTARGNRVSNILNSTGSLLSRQRNEVVTAFLDDTTAEWLFFIDSDETITPEVFDKICDAAHDKDRPIVAGLYFGVWPSGGLYPQPVPMIFRFNEHGQYNAVEDFPTDATIRIDAAGTGALLIHRSVVQAMREASNAGPLAVHEAGKWCFFRDQPVGGAWFGEDVFFCRQAQSLGFPLHAATGARLRHRKSYWLTDRQFNAYQEGKSCGDST